MLCIRPVPGELAIVTQSAAIGTYLVNWCWRIGLGIRHWVHTGNEADVTVLELARVLADRGDVRALALRFESLRDLEDLHETLRTLARAGIATGVLQAGTSTIGRLASQAHTAALIGDQADLLGDLVESAGAYPAGSVSGLVNVLQAALDHPTLPPAPRLGFVSTSGPARRDLEDEVFGKRILVTARDTWTVAEVVASHRSQSDAGFGFRRLKDPHVVSLAPCTLERANIRVHTQTCVFARRTTQATQRKPF